MGIIRTVVMVSARAFVEIRDGNSRHGDVSAQRQFRIFDWRLEDRAQFFFCVVIVIALLSQMHEYSNGHILITSEVLFSSVEDVSFCVVSNPYGSQLGSMVEVLKEEESFLHEDMIEIDEKSVVQP